jgi:hypothetical protein
MTTYRFRRITADNGPDDRSFEADTPLQALQLASDVWFGGTRVADWQPDGKKITLLSNSPSGNVIGVVYHP